MDSSEQSRRTRQNVIALIVLAIVLVGGAWLFHALKRSAGTRGASLAPAP